MEHQTGWRSTGLHWESAAPTLTASAPQGDPRGEHRRLAVSGLELAWSLTGPRRCIGVWTGADRVACPVNALIRPDGTDPQCPACAWRDRGRRIARDAAGDDGRVYQLYLAWFGPGLLKVGLTAAQRDRDRLLEQGAIAYALLASGHYPAIRRAETAIARSGHATERISGRAKSDAWWSLLNPAERAESVRAVHENVRAVHKSVLDDVTPLACEVVDQAADFGLDTPPPNSYAQATSVNDPAHLAGRIRAVIGRHLFLDTAECILLIDMRRIAGWTISPASSPLTAGIGRITRTRPKDDHDDQEALF